LGDVVGAVHRFGKRYVCRIALQAGKRRRWGCVGRQKHGLHRGPLADVQRFLLEANQAGPAFPGARVRRAKSDLREMDFGEGT
jgi:hypothetical protein